MDKLYRLDKQSCPVEKCISLAHSRGRSEKLSSRTNRASGQNYYRLDKITCRLEKCIFFGMQLFWNFSDRGGGGGIPPPP